MGIDVYIKWQGQTDAERQAQFTGWSTTHGHTGYLREAYHGNPYATRVLVPEAFAADRDGVAIPAATLRERLPRTLLAALVRDRMLYSGEHDPSRFAVPGDTDAVISTLGPMLIGRLKASKHQPADFENDVPPEVLSLANLQLRLGAKTGWLPAFAQTYVDFVGLYARLEAEGKAPTIRVSA